LLDYAEARYSRFINNLGESSPAYAGAFRNLNYGYRLSNADEMLLVA